MFRRSRLVSALLTAGVLSAAVSSHALAAAVPHIPRHVARSIPGRQVTYRAGVQDGRTTRVDAPRDGRARLAGAATVFHIQFKGDGWTAAAKAVMKDAAAYWGSQLQSSVPITVVATLKDLPGNVLGSAGPASMRENWTQGTPPPLADTFYPIALANKLAGVDLNGSNPEITARFDSRMPWYMGLDNVVPSNRISFRGTVLHELGHGLGFVGSAWGGSGPSIGQDGDPWVFDLFAERGDGVNLWNAAAGAPNLGPDKLRSALRSNDLWFSGPATAPRGKLYAPATWDPGSSYSHLDETLYPRGTLDSLMTPIGDYGEGNATAGPIALHMLQDMGWDGAPPTACSQPGDLDSDGFNDVVGVSGTGDLVLAPGTGTGTLLGRRVRGAGFEGPKPMVIEDLTGDGCADLVAYRVASRELVLLPVTGDLELGSSSTLVTWIDGPTTWTVTGLAAVGDMTGDGDPDLLVRADQAGPTPQKGQLWLLRGDGAGHVGTPRFVSAGWAGYTAFFSAGDWDRDGAGDLFVRAKVDDGTLKLFRADGHGGLRAPRAKGTGWNAYAGLFGSFDLSGDGRADVVGREPDGDLRIARSDASGGFQRGTPVISRGWTGFPVVD